MTLGDLDSAAKTSPFLLVPEGHNFRLISPCRPDAHIFVDFLAPALFYQDSDASLRPITWLHEALLSFYHLDPLVHQLQHEEPATLKRLFGYLPSDITSTRPCPGLVSDAQFKLLLPRTPMHLSDLELENYIQILERSPQFYGHA